MVGTASFDNHSYLKFNENFAAETPSLCCMKTMRIPRNLPYERNFDNDVWKVSLYFPISTATSEFNNSQIDYRSKDKNLIKIFISRKLMLSLR